MEEELAELQDTLATKDFYDAMSRIEENAQFGGAIESYLLLKRRQAIAIKMGGNKNHRRPHVHVDYGTEFHAASFAIDNGERLVGDDRYDSERNKALDIKASGQTGRGVESDTVWQRRHADCLRVTRKRFVRRAARNVAGLDFDPRVERG